MEKVKDMGRQPASEKVNDDAAVSNEIVSGTASPSGKAELSEGILTAPHSSPAASKRKRSSAFWWGVAPPSVSSSTGSDEGTKPLRRRVRTKSEQEGNRCLFSKLHIDVKAEILSYLVGTPAFWNAWVVCKEWNTICRGKKLWRRIPSFKPDGSLNRDAFEFLGLKNKGTEGLCFKVIHRSSGRTLALKKARVHPDAEGVPYYMLRELSFLKSTFHPNIATLEKISLVDNELHLIFNYTEMSLLELINPYNDPNGGFPLPFELVRRFLYQILQATDFCHQRGVLHRNLKPKHMLVDIPRLRAACEMVKVCEEMGSAMKAQGDEAVEAGKHPKPDMNTYKDILNMAMEGIIRISDFALVRSTAIPLRHYTAEVVTLWYRSPEVLLGGNYFTAVDVWSIGCVFAEMMIGKPLFPGICEIDQLFQLFLKLGTPNDKSWPGFSSLTHYQRKFPKWPVRGIESHVPSASKAAKELLSEMLVLNPTKRISARHALAHELFDGVRKPLDDFIENERGRCNNPPEAGGEEFRRSFPPSGTMDLNEMPKRMQPYWKLSPRAAEMKRPCEFQSPLYLVRYFHFLREKEQAVFPIRNYIERSGSLQEDLDQDEEEDPTSSDVLAHLQEPAVMEGDDGFLKPIHRTVLVDWLVEVVDVFEMSIRSVYMAMSFFDRFLARGTIERRKLQLLGATCLHIASKLEDVSYIGVEDLVLCADRVYEASEVLELEEMVLNKLMFDLHVPTTIDFVHIFLTRFGFNDIDESLCVGLESTRPLVSPYHGKISSTVKSMASYLSELSLLNNGFFSEIPSLVAASVITLSFYYMDVQINEERIIDVTGYSLQDLSHTIQQLHRAQKDASHRNSHRVVVRRYVCPEMNNVAIRNIPNELTGFLKAKKTK